MVAHVDDLGLGGFVLWQLDGRAVVDHPDIHIEIVAARLDQEQTAGLAIFANGLDRLADTKGHALGYVAMNAPCQTAGIEKLGYAHGRIGSGRIEGKADMLTLWFDRQVMKLCRTAIVQSRCHNRRRAKTPSGGVVLAAYIDSRVAWASARLVPERSCRIPPSDRIDKLNGLPLRCQPEFAPQEPAQ